MRSRLLALSLGGLAAVAAAVVPLRESEAVAVADPVSKEEAEGIIFERQQLMIMLEKDSEVLGEIAAGLRPADKLAQVTRSIADTAKDVKTSFEPHVPGGRSKPEVWSNQADYTARLDVFIEKSEEMARLGEQGNLQAVTAMLGTALPCKQCHDVYRAPKK